MSTPVSSSIRRDIASAYLASAAKVASWAIVSALIYRRSRTDFAMFALVRATIGLLNYTSLGLAPAMVRVIARARREGEDASSAPPRANPSGVFDYAGPPPKETDPATIAYSNGQVVAILSASVAMAITIGYAFCAGRIHRVPTNWNPAGVRALVAFIGTASVFRLWSDAPGALLQTHGRIARDNSYLIAAEFTWVLITIVAWMCAPDVVLQAAVVSYAGAAYLLLLARLNAAYRITGIRLPKWETIDTAILRQLLSTGLVIAVAQLADFLYAPTDYILINHFLGPNIVAVYAPAVQIDAALLLLVTGVASVLLPRTAVAHVNDDLATVRRYYIRGTLGSTAILVAAALFTWLVSPLLLRIWLGKHFSHAETLAILPLVLIHTVVGGSSAVGRSILLAIGRVRAFTISVLIAGAGNVLLSWFFVSYLNLGLRGIIYGTILAVVARCALWMPAYVLWTLRKTDAA
jgi:O-antigen/teichoic acid export membrane protein